MRNIWLLIAVGIVSFIDLVIMAVLAVINYSTKTGKGDWFMLGGIGLCVIFGSVWYLLVLPAKEK